MHIQLYKLYEDEMMVSNQQIQHDLQETVGRLVTHHVLKHRDERVTTQRAGINFHILMPEQITRLKAAFKALHISDNIIDGLLSG